MTNSKPSSVALDAKSAIIGARESLFGCVSRSARWVLFKVGIELSPRGFRGRDVVDQVQESVRIAAGALTDEG